MYIKLSTMEFPRYEGDIRLEHPEISEDQTGPTFTCPDTYAPVKYVHTPNYDPKTQEPIMNPPIKNEVGEWMMSWTIVDLSPEEIEERKIFAENMVATIARMNENRPKP